MRPVNRGNPTQYPNYPTVQPPWDVRQAIDFLFSTVRVGARSYPDSKRSQIEGIQDDLFSLTDQLFTPAQLTLPPGADGNINRLSELAEIQERKWDQAVDSGSYTDEQLMSIAQHWIFVLERQIAWYEAAVKTYKRRINATYALARGDLITNIGQYCSYCEMPLAASLAVEHQLPKAWFWRQSVNWSNFLLACPICNSIKKDHPSLAQGVAEAKKSIPQPTWTQIEDAARTLYVWPNDATNYTGFGTAFQHQLYFVHYLRNGTVFKERALTPIQAQNFISERRLSMAPDDGSGSGFISARVYPLLGEIRDNDAQTTLQFLNTVTSAAAITPNNVGGVPQALINTFAQVDVNNPELLAPAAQYQIQLGVTNQVVIGPAGANTWTVTQTDNYMLSTASRITVSTLMGNVLYQSRTQGAYTTDMAALGEDLLPDAIATALGVDLFGRTITITPAGEGSGRNTFIIMVNRTYRIRYEQGVVRLYADQQFPLQIRLTGTTDKARFTTEEIGLNKFVVNDPKYADRRTIRRIRAFFAALEALQCLEDAQGLNNAQLVTDLRGMIIQNAKATGFWSVWHQVFSAFLADQNPVKAPLLNALNSAFPGTR